MTMLTKLNLGSGAFKKAGYINLDSDKRTDPDILHDLDATPYPFPNQQFQVIEADHVLEHLTDPWAVMRELHRISKPGGRITIRVPHFSRGFTHADHKRGFDVTFPYYFKPDFKGGYMGPPLKLEQLRLTWFAQHYLKKTVLARPTFHGLRILGIVIDTLANLSPALCSRIWCYWVGGFEQIEFQFTIPEEDSTE